MYPYIDRYHQEKLRDLIERYRAMGDESPGLDHALHLIFDAVDDLASEVGTTRYDEGYDAGSDF